MAPEPYLYRIFHRPASGAQVLINGVPLYHRAPDKHVTPSGPVSHLLVPGENTASIMLWEMPPDPKAPYLPVHFMLQILRAEDESAIASWEYPGSLKAAGLEPVLPVVHDLVFHPEGELPEPVFLRGSRESFDELGTPEQHAAVAELHEAFGSRDAARFEEAMRVKVDEFERYYGAQPQSRAEALERLNEPWVMAPLDPRDLRFDRYLDGRVAYVRRASGKPAVRATHRDEPYLGWGANLYLTRLDGRWRIFL